MTVIFKGQDLQATWFADKDMNAQELFMYIPIHPSHRVPQIPGAFCILYCKTFTVHKVKEANHILLIGEIQDTENTLESNQKVLLAHKQHFYTVQ